VLQAYTGGSFGGKDDVAAEIGCLAAVAALRVQAAVMIVHDRGESILGSNLRHAVRIHYRTGGLKDGSVLVGVGLTDMGQGSRTVFAQVAAEVLGVTMDRVTVRQVDTDSVHDSGPTVASRSTTVGGMAVYKTARKFDDTHGCGIQIHVAEIPRAFLVEKYGKSAPQVLEETGMLGADVLAVHCIDMTDEDLEIFQRSGVHVAHTPMTNSLGGNGVARVPEMLEMGINVSLGHDCFFTLDTPEYIRYAYLLHKAHNANPMLLPPFQALDLVLGNGARALGLQERIGGLAAGKRADILIIRPDAPGRSRPPR
jgi:hypothetical protein